MSIELLPGVHRLIFARDDGIASQSHLVAADVPTLIDTALPGAEDQFMTDLGTASIAPERLVITHGHLDHTGCIEAVLDEYDVELWLPAGLTLDPAVAADHRFEHGDGIGPFEAVSLPGHTPINYALYDPERQLLAAGDSVLGSDFRGLPPGYLTPPPAILCEDAHEAELSLYDLLELDFEVALVGHGEPVTQAARDRLARFLQVPLPEATRKAFDLDY